tara:strand:+ start:913 stop:1329 length:417 start_codon:yes stop_codon:yes gene_type:complete
MSGVPWIAAAVHLRRNGSTLKQIAEEISVPLSTMRPYLLSAMTEDEYLSLKKPTRNSERADRIRLAIREGERSMASIAEDEGVSRQYVYSVKWKLEGAVDKAIKDLGDKDYVDDKVGILQSQDESNKAIEEIERMLDV